MKTIRHKSALRALSDDRRGVAAVEFAISGSLLFVFMFGIINLGDLSFTIVALQTGVQNAARFASITTSTALANGTAMTYACPTQATIQGQFAAAVSPPFSGTGAPAVAVSWSGSLAPCSNNAGTGVGTVTVSTKFQWFPIGLQGIWANGISLAPTETLAVMNAGGASSGS